MRRRLTSDGGKRGFMYDDVWCCLFSSRDGVISSLVLLAETCFYLLMDEGKQKNEIVEEKEYVQWGRNEFRRKSNNREIL